MIVFFLEQSHTPSSGTSSDSLDPVLLTPEYTFRHAAIPADDHKGGLSPRHPDSREAGREGAVDQTHTHTHTHSPVIVMADHLPPGFIPTSPSFVPLVLGGNAKAGEGVRGASGGERYGGYEIYAGRAVVPDDVAPGRGVFTDVGDERGMVGRRW